MRTFIDTLFRHLIAHNSIRLNRKQYATPELVMLYIFILGS